VRPARPADVGTLLHMKREFAIQEQTEFALRATADDWLRDGFGPRPRFEAGLAERDGAAAGMITFSERYYTGWAGSSLYIQDLYVDPAHRGHGVAGVLLAWVASVAVERACPFVELTVRTDNPAQELYRGAGFQPVESCATLVLAGPALAKLGGVGNGPAEGA
jgi:ribosomal protein S18 acetylase RimI-like enzyme